ncbi:MAG TPA: VOC family protein [Mycobacteriales bacterium]|nr:VOC family protein [Mycobacteriales bacterium]
MALPRIRQVVLAAADLAAVTDRLETDLGIETPFHDEGVGHFGLHNAVYSLGDTFLEVVSPVRDDTAVGRHRERCGGDAGYMVMFEVADVVATRDRLQTLGVRIVWDTSHPDIVDLHLHPKDVGGALVALDITEPVGSWRWGGPAWTAVAPTPPPGGVRGLTVAVTQPDKVARRWAEVIGLEMPRDTVLRLDGGRQSIRFVDSDGRGDRFVAVEVDVPGRDGPVDIAGVTFNRHDIGGSQA